MNNTIQSMKNHRSIRRYLDKEIPSDVLQSILEATQLMPTSINSQQVSIIVVRDLETKAKLAELAGGQPWIKTASVFLLFVADLYKTDIAAKINGSEQMVQESVEGSLAAILDCGIALGGAIVAAESLGLGTVPIGGIRKNAKQVIQLLNLPKYTFPINGLCIGYPQDESSKKPRLPLDSFAHSEVYHPDKLEQQIAQYDKEMAKYLHSVGRAKEINWSSLTSSIYKNLGLPNIKPTMLAQGFKFN